ncbi:MAG: hypothetical protein HS104_30800 [Polyangiaceae bacterium]|nr:hypothetical protein [Polyangiaceae bacterium]MCL4755955.1 hypothetical protein [Myxococcales bacterium]
MRRLLVLSLLVGAGGALWALRHARPAGGAEPERLPATPVEPAAPATAPSPEARAPDARLPEVRFVPISGEAPARVAPAQGDSRRVVVYLHGFCSDASTIAEWAPAVQRHATLIAPHGELGCAGQPGHFRWGNDIRFTDYRVQRAIRSVGKALGVELAQSDVTLAGYSEGASRAESLAWLFPQHYRRAVLMSGPAVPAFEKVRGLERVAVLRGGREYRRTYRLAAEHFDKAGVSARFWELPGASHGELGPEAPRVLGEVFDFVER